MKRITFYLPKLRLYIEYMIGASANLLGVLCNFLIQLVLIKAIGVAAFGQFAVWRNNVLLAGSLGTLSINTLLVKKFSPLRGSGDHEATRPLRRKSTVIVIIASIMFGTGIGGMFTPDHISLPLLLTASLLYAVLVLWASSTRALFGGLLTLFAERAIQPFLFLVGSIVCITVFRQDSLEEVARLYVASIVMTIMLVRALSWSKAKHGQAEASGTFFDGLNDGYRAILKRSMPFFLVSIGTYASNRLPLLVAGWVLDGYAIGQLAFMQSLGGLVIALLFSFNMIAGPNISQALHKNEFRKAFGEVRKMLIILAPLGILVNVLILFSIPVTEFLLGVKNLAPFRVFVAFLISGYIYAMFTAPAIFLQMAGQEKKLAQVTNGAFLLKLIIVIPLAQRFGLMGFAIAELVHTSALGLTITALYVSSRKRLLTR